MTNEPTSLADWLFLLAAQINESVLEAVRGYQNQALAMGFSEYLAEQFARDMHQCLMGLVGASIKDKIGESN